MNAGEKNLTRGNTAAADSVSGKTHRRFDVYMKTPYRLMDASKQKRQMNRQRMNKMSYIQSPSKTRLNSENRDEIIFPVPMDLDSQQSMKDKKLLASTEKALSVV